MITHTEYHIHIQNHLPFFCFRLRVLQKNMGFLILVALCLVHSKSEIVVNPAFATKTSASCVRVDGLKSKQISRIQQPGPDIDIGPYCSINSTSNSMVTGVFASFGFLVTNTQCKGVCSLAGCTWYRETSVNSGSFNLMNQCLVAESFYYSVQGSMFETWCPFYDWNASVFTFKGRVYKDQWYWLGWPTRDDCMQAVLCGPTSHFFDYSQTLSKAWCQPTPLGSYSPQCTNTILPCSAPTNITGPTSFWTSHGYGHSSGCGMRMGTPSFLTAPTSMVSGFTQSWNIRFVLTLLGPFPTSPAQTIILGVFTKFFIGIKYIDISTVKLFVFHQYYDSVSSVSISWYPGETKIVAFYLDPVSQGIQFYLNDLLLGPFIWLTWATLFLMPHNISALPANATSLIHIGPYYTIANDFPDSTFPVNPYDNQAQVDFQVCTVSLAAGNIVTTTTTTTSTTTRSTTTTSTTITTTTSTSTTTTTSMSAPPATSTSSITTSTTTTSSSSTSMSIAPATSSSTTSSNYTSTPTTSTSSATTSTSTTRLTSTSSTTSAAVLIITPTTPLTHVTTTASSPAASATSAASPTRTVEYTDTSTTGVVTYSYYFTSAFTTMTVESTTSTTPTILTSPFPNFVTTSIEYTFGATSDAPMESTQISADTPTTTSSTGLALLIGLPVGFLFLTISICICKRRKRGKRKSSEVWDVSVLENHSRFPTTEIVDLSQGNPWYHESHLDPSNEPYGREDEWWAENLSTRRHNNSLNLPSVIYSQDEVFG